MRLGRVEFALVRVALRPPGMGKGGGVQLRDDKFTVVAVALRKALLAIAVPNRIAEHEEEQSFHEFLVNLACGTTQRKKIEQRPIPQTVRKGTVGTAPPGRRAKIGHKCPALRTQGVLWRVNLQ